MITAFAEGFDDCKAEFGVKRNGGGIICFDAENDGCVPGAAGGIDEGGEQGFAKALSTRGGGHAYVGQFELAGGEVVLVRRGKYRLGKLQESGWTGESEAQHLGGKPSEGLAQLGVEGGWIGGAKGVTIQCRVRGAGCVVDGAKGDDGRVFLGEFVIAQDDRLAQIRQEGGHGGGVQVGESRDELRGQVMKIDKGISHRRQEGQPPPGLPQIPKPGIWGRRKVMPIPGLGTGRRGGR
jgi:hypothetical protein